MNQDIHDFIAETTGAKTVHQIAVIQRLWSGYGDIVRYGLTGCDRDSVIVKQVRLTEQDRHPRGWDGDLSHRRKIRSYRVETAWYAHWSRHCDAACRMPACLAFESFGDDLLMVLEDLDAVGYPERRSTVNEGELIAYLSWLAHFHATFIGERPEGLWPTGTYWQLESRPDEWRALSDSALKKAASAIGGRRPVISNSPSRNRGVEASGIMRRLLVCSKRLARP